MLISIIQMIALAFVYTVAILAFLLGLYLGSPTLRDWVVDFEIWADRHGLLRLREQKYLASDIVNHGFMSPNEFRTLKDYAEADIELVQKMFNDGWGVAPTWADPPNYDSVFEETAAARGVDPRDIIRSEKEQDAKDQETLDIATEFHNDPS